jgi:hypothetical protein
LSMLRAGPFLSNQAAAPPPRMLPPDVAMTAPPAGAQHPRPEGFLRQLRGCLRPALAHLRQATLPLLGPQISHSLTH